MFSRLKAELSSSEDEFIPSAVRQGPVLWSVQLKVKTKPGSILAYVEQRSLCQNNTAGLEIAWAPTIQQRSEFENWLVYAATWIIDECPEDFTKIIKMLQDQGPGQTAAKLIFFFQWPWHWEFEVVSQVLFSLNRTIKTVPGSYLSLEYKWIPLNPSPQGLEHGWT